MTALSLRRRLLIVLADEGTVEHPAGKVPAVLAGLLDAPTRRVSDALRQAAAQGLVEVKRNELTGRVFRARLTAAGRAEVSGSQHAGRVVSKRRPDPAKPAPTPPAMPILGPIARHPFDADQARERALGGVA